MPTSVKYFNSTMSGAPALSGTAGTLVGLLDACLVNGFGSVTLTSLVVADNVATGTVSGGHQFAMIGNAIAGYVGPVITIAGATPSGLNGEWRLASVPSSTQFTFATTGISSQTATGTITAKRSPAGWAKTYSGTNKAAYSRTALGATAMLLRVDDTPAQYPKVYMYETMSNVDTGTGVAPTSGYRTTAKSSTANGTARPWRLIADGKLFYLFMYQDGTNCLNGLIFGDINSYMSADAYHCLLVPSYTNDSVSPFALYAVSVSATGHLARSYTQTGSAIESAHYTHLKHTYFGYGGSAYPNPVHAGLNFCPVEAWETTVNVRGLYPGLFAPVHAAISYPVLDGNIFGNFTNYPDRKFLGQSMGEGGILYNGLLDLSGPWR